METITLNYSFEKCTLMLSSDLYKSKIAERTLFSLILSYSFNSSTHMLSRYRTHYVIKRHRDFFIILNHNQRMTKL